MRSSARCKSWIPEPVDCTGMARSDINAPMADPHRYELDELSNRPGTYFNPQTEVLVVVDDSPDVDHEIFGTEQSDDGEWVLISDEAPVDEHRRDELIESFQVAYHPAGEQAVVDEDSDEVDENDELEPDEEIEPE
jgi:hypothetical protein